MLLQGGAHVPERHLHPLDTGVVDASRLQPLVDQDWADAADHRRADSDASWLEQGSGENAQNRFRLPVRFVTVAEDGSLTPR